MNQQDNETVDYLMSDENDERDFFQFDDLTLTDEQFSEIKGGPGGWGCVGCGYANHNETTAEDDADEIDLDDLTLTGEQLAEIKAGCLGCTWGPPVLNHNETTAEDDVEEIELDDLMLSDVQGNQVKAGESDDAYLPAFRITK